MVNRWGQLKKMINTTCEYCDKDLSEAAEDTSIEFVVVGHIVLECDDVPEEVKKRLIMTWTQDNDGST